MWSCAHFQESKRSLIHEHYSLNLFSKTVSKATNELFATFLWETFFFWCHILKSHSLILNYISWRSEENEGDISRLKQINIRRARVSFPWCFSWPRFLICALVVVMEISIFPKSDLMVEVGTRNNAECKRIHLRLRLVGAEVLCISPG